MWSADSREMFQMKVRRTNFGNEYVSLTSSSPGNRGMIFTHQTVKDVTKLQQLEQAAIEQLLVAKRRAEQAMSSAPLQ